MDFIFIFINVAHVRTPESLTGNFKLVFHIQQYFQKEEYWSMRI